MPASRGTIARRYPYSYEQGLGHEIEDYEWDGLRLPGWVMDLTEAKSSEHNHAQPVPPLGAVHGSRELGRAGDLANAAAAGAAE